jgi:hypothetical protein
MKTLPTPVCKCCDRIARDIPSIQLYAALQGIPPEEYVITYDSTYNAATGEFLCYSCIQLQVQEASPSYFII